MNILHVIAEFCSNVGYATITAAIIGGIFVILGIVFTQHLRKKSAPPLISIPPKDDPLSKLTANPGEMKKIDDMDVKTQKYSEALAIRLALTKDPDSVADVYYRGEETDDD